MRTIIALVATLLLLSLVAGCEKTIHEARGTSTPASTATSTPAAHDA